MPNDHIVTAEVTPPDFDNQGLLVIQVTEGVGRKLLRLLEGTRWQPGDGPAIALIAQAVQHAYAEEAKRRGEAG